MSGTAALPQRRPAVAVLREAIKHTPNEDYVAASQALDRLERVLEEAALRADGAGNLRALRKAIYSARWAA
ncbi:hypothetical protein [Stenotrophomonas sp. NLF4-10]|uniref:hypothetical protein n=1 Tax=Stenotrophomonas sp. NLF4-10 TaxID=2918754 RepID=UPI001EFB2ED1|nr:hypothetical protein [Stenotrophomonas sp. NLF4-10]MCG8275377.1 hypothetical protein [Stenotrophomonas sp. NLF4-10]